MSHELTERQAQKHLKTAAAPTLRRVRADRRKASSTISALLAHIERHLFDQELNVNRLKEACGVRNNSVAIFFHIEVDSPPGAYIARGRLETAANLLAATEMPIWQIADLVGYSGMPTFSRAFHRRYEVRPRAFRKLCLAGERPVEPEENATSKTEPETNEPRDERNDASADGTERGAAPGETGPQSTAEVGGAESTPTSLTGPRDEQVMTAAW